MDETKTLARFAAGLKYEDLPAGVVEKTKQLILDQLGCQLAGSALPWGRRAYEFASEFRSVKEESTVVNYGLVTSAQDAAFVNGCFGHGFLGDDADSVCFGHFGSIIIPSALAIAERERASGREFMRAVVLGYEITSRIGAAGREAMLRGFHPGPIFGPFGVAAAAGSLLNFSEEQFLHALAIAGSHSSGLMEYSVTGGTVNRLHSGIAAQNGIRAALFAERGFQGPTRIIEGERGFLTAFSGLNSLDEITRGLGEKFRVLLIELKAHSCCGSSSAIFDAISGLRREQEIRWEEIEEIVIHVSPQTFNLTGSIVEPKDVTSAQFSGSFGTALGLVKGSNHFKEYTEENLRDPDLLSVARKTRLIVDEELAKKPMTNNPARVTIREKNGAGRSKVVLAAKGSLLNPMTEEEVAAKFKDFASDALPLTRADRVVESVAGLDSLGDVRELLELLVVRKDGAGIRS